MIPRRFRGPEASANGGYTCGTIAELVDADVVEVTLRKPPPLDVEFAVERDGDGDPRSVRRRARRRGAAWRPRPRAAVGARFHRSEAALRRAPRRSRPSVPRLLRLRAARRRTAPAPGPARGRSGRRAVGRGARARGRAVRVGGARLPRRLGRSAGRKPWHQPPRAPDRRIESRRRRATSASSSAGRSAPADGRKRHAGTALFRGDTLLALGRAVWFTMDDAVRDATR